MIYWSNILRRVNKNRQLAAINTANNKSLCRTQPISNRPASDDAKTPKESRNKPTASEVLTCHLQNNHFPPWTSYFVKYGDIVNDQRGLSHFNWTLEREHNYHILRTGCYPYIKYHCSKRPHQDLSLEDTFYRVIKVMNLGLPCLAYGIAAIYLIKHTEPVHTAKGVVNIYFLYEEDKGSMY